MGSMQSDLQGAAAAESEFDPQTGLAEFAELNRRRLFGSPPLEVEQLERWLDLRMQLERHFGTGSSRSWSQAERRQFFRLTTHILIRVAAGEASQMATAIDLSQGGLFIETRQPLQTGARVQLQLAPPDERRDPVELAGTVAWVGRHGRGGPSGMGIEFVDLSDEQRAAIAKLFQSPLPDGLTA